VDPLGLREVRAVDRLRRLHQLDHRGLAEFDRLEGAVRPLVIAPRDAEESGELRGRLDLEAPRQVVEPEQPLRLRARALVSREALDLSDELDELGIDGRNR
jgi:hypothetical protein